MRALWLLLLVLSGCATSWQAQESPPELVSLHLIDRDGLSESIANPDRLETYASTDFLSPQPYQKVFRIYSRDATGVVHAYITTYHTNGQVKQYLEIVNNRACGAYREWFPNGQQKIEATIVEGSADISLAAEKSWIFDGSSKAWNDAGNLLADIPYARGTLEGVSRYYHPKGTLWKEVPYAKSRLNGDLLIYLETGALFQSTHYVNGIKQGRALRYWNPQAIASDEWYEQGRLLNATYHDAQGQLISSIENGLGLRAIFGKEGLSELHEYHHGVPEGKVQVFDVKGRQIKVHHVKNGLKQGEELIFFTLPGKETKTKLSMQWYQGKIQGVVRTWYDNGTMESQREMSENKRNGLSSAWYRDGQLMLIEEYEQGKLKKGDYYRKGEKQPISQVHEGEGIVSYFDPEGTFIRKVNYHHGKPEI